MLQLTEQQDLTDRLFPGLRRDYARRPLTRRELLARRVHRWRELLALRIAPWLRPDPEDCW